MAHTIVGTPYYLSPELCEEKPYNHKSDIWSLGCVLYELCTFKHPFEAKNQGSLIMKIVKGTFTPIPSSYSKELGEMTRLLLLKDFRKRPGIVEILNMESMKQRMQLYGYT
jgi:NIMA (never in mitosis gene a)-related kinase